MIFWIYRLAFKQGLIYQIWSSRNLRIKEFVFKVHLPWEYLNMYQTCHRAIPDLSWNSPWLLYDLYQASLWPLPDFSWTNHKTSHGPLTEFSWTFHRPFMDFSWTSHRLSQISQTTHELSDHSPTSHGALTDSHGLFRLLTDLSQTSHRPLMDISWNTYGLLMDIL